MRKTARKIGIVGAGNVGSSLAMLLAQSGLGRIVLLDIYRDMAAAKALDMQDALSVLRIDGEVIGTDDYAEVEGAEIVVVTAGIPRKPGMQRKDLIATNSSIIKMVVENVKKYAPNSIIIMVTNPLDSMTYLSFKVSGFPRERIIGMAGVLDGARMVAQISRQFDVSINSVEAVIMGSHGNEMVPVISHTKVNFEKILGEYLKNTSDSQKKLDEIVERTRKRGAEIVRLLGKGSAYFAPSASVYKMIKSILGNTKDVVAASVYLDGEYGLKDICIGVPIVLGSRGVESIVEIALNKTEKDAFLKAADAIRETIALL